MRNLKNKKYIGKVFALFVSFGLQLEMHFFKPLYNIIK